jgi:hypothetical protein
VKRPNLATANRRQATEYIRYLEGQVEDLEKRLSAAVKGAGDNAPPAARVTDPATSHSPAAMAYPKSGQNRWKCLMEIAIAGERGLIQDEVIKRSGVNGAWKRISELVAGGWVAPHGTRKGKSGTEQRVYVVTPQGVEAIKADGSAIHIHITADTAAAVLEQEA